ncbi:MAG: TetR/AcrR family transcriptional regulator [Spirochaetaceae bacterium]|nr:MAG: TetR/AcrR family transcriptional regulator [Spirochaetaceae bacterium]
MSKKTGNIDLRIRRTRKMLLDSLISLIVEKGFEALTVKDIAEKAMINRATFYNHYEDKLDLLERGMDEVFDELTQLAEKPHENGKEVLESGPPRAMIAALKHMAENSNFYKAMLGKNGVPAFIERIQKYNTEIIRRRIEYLVSQSKQKPLVPLEIVVNYTASSYSGMAVWWIQNDMPIPAEEMVRHYITLNVLGLYRCLGLTVPD